MRELIPLLIIGAGPFGLVMSAYVRRFNIDHLVVGNIMDFWKSNMPKGMYLRSGCDWHYDPFNEDTIERYLETKNLKPADVEPLRLDFYLGYCDWFRKQKAIEVLPAWVQQLNYVNDTPPFFEAVLQDGRSITAKNVVLALGFRYFKNVPEPYSTLFPPGRFAHTCDFVDFTSLNGKRVRQSRSLSDRPLSPFFQYWTIGNTIALPPTDKLSEDSFMNGENNLHPSYMDLHHK